MSLALFTTWVQPPILVIVASISETEHQNAPSLKRTTKIAGHPRPTEPKLKANHFLTFKKTLGYLLN